MKHHIITEGKSYRLRPVTIEDAQTIIDLRNPSNERNKHIGRISENLQDQINWIERYYNREGDYYFIGENLSTNHPECLIRLYDIENGKGEWGSIVTTEGSFVVAEATMLLLDVAFHMLSLDAVYSRVSVNNINAINYNDNIGNVRKGILRDFYEFDGERHDAVDYYMTNKHYETVVRPNLEKSVNILYARNLRNAQRCYYGKPSG